MKNNYTLKLLNPSSNKWKSSQSEYITIDADTITIRDGVIIFMKIDGINQTYVAIYPVNYTIIEKIKRNEVSESE